MRKHILVDVELSEWDDRELTDEMSKRGYVCVSQEDYLGLEFDREDWQFLLELIDKQPENWYTRRIRDKILHARFGI